MVLVVILVSVVTAVDIVIVIVVTRVPFEEYEDRDVSVVVFDVVNSVGKDVLDIIVVIVGISTGLLSSGPVFGIEDTVGVDEEDVKDVLYNTLLSLIVSEEVWCVGVLAELFICEVVGVVSVDVIMRIYKKRYIWKLRLCFCTE